MVSASCLLVKTPKPHLPVELRIINIDRQTGKQFIIKLRTNKNKPEGSDRNRMDIDGLKVGRPEYENKCYMYEPSEVALEAAKKATKLYNAEHRKVITVFVIEVCFCIYFMCYISRLSFDGEVLDFCCL